MERTIPAQGRSALPQALDYGHELTDMGVPVFACRLNAAGDPFPPDGWQELEPSHERVDRWRRGMALCAVTGIVFDVLDCDPRNGGRLSLSRLSRELGDDGPDVFWDVRTSSGGSHRWITPLRIGTRPGFQPGLDLKGGMPDGTSRGFVFIPPTIRPSKDPATFGERMPYVARTAIGPPSGNVCAALRNLIERPDGAPAGTGRKEPELLRAACLAAEEGSQRPALMAYTAELQKRGYARSDTLRLLRDLVGDMPAFDPRRPWYPVRGANPDSALLGLFYRDGDIIPDATPAEAHELASLSPMSPSTSGPLTPLADVNSKLTRWLWRRYLAIGDITILDADPGTAKSLISLDLAARFTRGRPMPGEDASSVEPGSVLILAPEDRAEVIKARLDAAGGDLSMAYVPGIEVRGKGRGKKAFFGGTMLTFPDKIDVFADWIERYSIGLVIVDPIAAFLSESVNSHNDASVRRALEPLAVVLGARNASAFLIRHLNKDQGKDVRYRGGGSTAFGAVSRIQLFAAPLPSGVGVGATHGLATIKNNHLAKRPDDCLTYEITDSVIVADEDGNMVPIIRWHGSVSLSLSALGGGNSPARRGPEAELQKEVEDILEQLFSVRDTWPVKEALAELSAAGISVSRPTLDKVRGKLGIKSRQTFDEIGKSNMWVWSTAKERIPGRKRASDEASDASDDGPGYAGVKRAVRGPG